MLTQPPIEGNLDCKARPFHSELCFDTATFQLRPKLAQSFHLLRRYHMEHLLTPRDFFYPRVAMDFYQSMTTKQHWTQRRGVLLEALFRMSEGYFFSPHHLIMAVLLYFEEKVHKKKLQRADTIPLLFPSYCAKFWSTWGIPITAPAIPKAPPVTPASSQPSTSAEPRMAIPISEYRELCRSLDTLTASQSSLAHEMAAIRGMPRADVGHPGSAHCHFKAAPASFDLPPAAELSTSTTAVPHSHPTEPQAPSGAPTEEADPSA
ncbi:hypothetical protein CK203_098553 [Vitis vinifera]|uniref:Uncharacterized protein n=1 Tax=Vitis vinifera TaxID=29760 RepID=A0A438BMP6_VITVI|nr:hypothetical protein CK203_098553 [Vitis vinifera]